MKVTLGSFTYYNDELAGTITDRVRGETFTGIKEAYIHEKKGVALVFKDETVPTKLLGMKTDTVCYPGCYIDTVEEE